MSVKDLAKKIPVVRRRLNQRGFGTSGSYWDTRYARGGDSGAGSYGRLAQFKADWLNTFVAEHDITHVLELGVGDGAQLALAEYPRFVGLDVSPTAVGWCKEKFAGDPTKWFAVHDARTDGHLVDSCDLALSLDVVYHLVEDDVFEAYMRHLFDASRQWVIIYSSDRDEQIAVHVRHRKFTDWVTANRPAWNLVEHVPNLYPGDGGGTSFADFYVYRRNETNENQRSGIVQQAG